MQLDFVIVITVIDAVLSLCSTVLIVRLTATEIIVIIVIMKMINASMPLFIFHYFLLQLLHTNGYG
jgi:hypothetical protein